MKIRAAHDPGCLVPQFVVEAGTDEEQLLLHAFLAFPAYAADGWIFHLHGYSARQDGPGYQSFNFGWIRTTRDATGGQHRAPLKDAPHTGDDDLLDELTEIRECVERALGELDVDRSTASDVDDVKSALRDAIATLTKADELRLAELAAPSKVEKSIAIDLLEQRVRQAEDARAATLAENSRLVEQLGVVRLLYHDAIDALGPYVAWHQGAHEAGCPEDDTCDCAGKPVNAAVNAVLLAASLRRVAREQLAHVQVTPAPTHLMATAENFPCSFSHHQHSTLDEAIACARPRRDGRPIDVLPRSMSTFKS